MEQEDRDILSRHKLLKAYLNSVKDCIAAGLFNNNELVYANLASKRAFLQYSLNVPMVNKTKKYSKKTIKKIDQ